MSNDESTRRLNQAAANLSSRWLTTLIDPDQVVELRALGVESPGGSIQVWAGVFRGDELQTLAKAALELSGCCKGVYYTLNPLKPDRLRVVAPRVQVAHGGELAKDIDIPARRWILVDFDPVRAEGFRDYSATDAEKAAAWDVVLSVRSWLGGRGWPDPIISDSGNGYHLLYRLAEDLPVSLPLGANDPIRQSLLALGARFGTSAVTIDGAVFNPARIVKFPGTLTCKGENLPDRPWRRAMILDMPAALGRVPLEMLQELASESTSAGSGSSQPSTRSSRTGDGDVIARARSYLQTIPAAQSGQRGHDRTYYAAGRLVRGFGLDDCAAFDLLREWNQTCQPPWSDEELWHKIRDQGRVPGPRGFLLTDARRQATGGDGGGLSGPLQNTRLTEIPNGETMKAVRVGRSIPQIFGELSDRTFGWPKRAGSTLFVEQSPGQVIWIKEPSELFGWIEIEFANDGEPGLKWGKDGPLRTDFFSGVEQMAESYDAVAFAPHHPPLPGVFYSHTPIKGGDGTALSGLIRYFTAATPEDEDLIRALILTLFWGGPGGTRPMFLITTKESDSEDAGRGAGKSIIVEMLGGLAGSVVSLRQDEKVSDLAKRLLGPSGANSRTVLLDNLKSHKFSSSALESLVTSTTISGHEMYEGEGQRPNFLTYCITANAGSLSKDLAKRSVTIVIDPPKYTLTWRTEVDEYIKSNKWAIIGDAIAELRSEPRPVQQITRWGTWQQGVLTRLPDPDRLIGLIVDRQKELDEDQSEADALREEIVRAIETPLSGISGSAEDAIAWFSAAQMAVLLSRATGERVNPVHAGRKIASLGVRGLKKLNLRTGKGWRWAGDRAVAAQGIDLSQNGDHPSPEFSLPRVNLIGD